MSVKSRMFFLARILAVDDNADVRLALKTIIEDAGHEFKQSDDGEGIVELAVSVSPDLILLDVMMPIVSGFDALATLKADPRTVQIPVIMVTAKGQPDDVALARSLGALEYIIKPWGEGDVELIVDWALSASKAS